jgi:hypothetical protein
VKNEPKGKTEKVKSVKMICLFPLVLQGNFLSYLLILLFQFLKKNKKKRKKRENVSKTIKETLF